LIITIRDKTPTVKYPIELQNSIFNSLNLYIFYIFNMAAIRIWHTLYVLFRRMKMFYHQCANNLAQVKSLYFTDISGWSNY